jgi:hypothetical protein
MATRFATALLIVTFPMMVSGCAAGVGVALLGVGAGVAAGTGVDYTLNGIAYKTYAEPASDVHVATRNALKHMSIPIASDTATKDGWEMVANAGDREIEIDVERLTANTTRLRVVANREAIFKDRATAMEIIAQTGDALEDRISTKSVKQAKR